MRIVILRVGRVPLSIEYGGRKNCIAEVGPVDFERRTRVALRWPLDRFQVTIRVLIQMLFHRGTAGFHDPVVRCGKFGSRDRRGTQKKQSRQAAKHASDCTTPKRLCLILQVSHRRSTSNRYNHTQMRIAFVLLATFGTTVTFAAELTLPSTALERSGPVHAIFRTSPLATGTGQLSLEWTDVYGRVVDRRVLPVEMNDEADIGFELDLRRAEAMQNQLRGHLVFDGQTKRGAADHRDQEAEITFVAKPPDRTWWDYAIIMWQNYSPAQFAKLKDLGINGSEYVGRNLSAPDFLLKNDLRWYAENIATDFYSAYHHYFPDRDTGWEFKQARAAHQKDPSSLEPFKRHPSLTDAAWL